jgi:histidinol-phosphate aminotransferase
MDIKKIAIIIILFLICIVILLLNSKNKIEGFSVNEKSLKNKIILITGSSKGFGYEIAKLLNPHNCKLIIVGRDPKGVETAEETLKKNNPNVKGLIADFTNTDDIYKMMEDAIKVWDHIDVVINMPIITKGSRFLASKDINDWKREQAVNFDSLFLINQLAIKNMKKKKIKGRVINVTTISAKHTSTKKSSGTDILTKNMVEKYTQMMAEEHYKEGIALVVLRLDEKIGSSTFDKIKLNLPKKATEVMNTFKNFDMLINASPKSVIPLVLYCIRSPFHEVSGKVISSKAYETDNKLSKVVPSHNLKLKNQFYDKIVYAPEKKNKDEFVYLVKQNPFGSSNKVTKMLSEYNFKKINDNVKTTSNISKLLADDLNIDQSQINFFKTEYDALKKIFELFVPKYQEIIAQYPTWSIFYLLCKEMKIDVKYLLLKENKGAIQPHLQKIKDTISPKTKLIYLSSPNSVTGQDLKKEEFERYIEDIPDNVIIFIDQRFVDFSKPKANRFDPLKYLDRNVIVLRSFNNFYGVENLENAYLIANNTLSNFINETIVINQVTKFDDDLMCEVYKDTKYYDSIRDKMSREKERVYKELKTAGINYFNSNTYFVLVETNERKATIKNKLEREKIILYESNDGHNMYWTLPLADKDINDKVIDVITN